MKYYVINSGNVSSEVFDNEAVVVNFVTGKYFGMSGSAPFIWRMFENPCSTEQVMDVLNGNTPITVDQVNALNAFIDVLVKEELLIDIDGPADTEPGAHVTHPGEYADPILEIYEDLQELIVLDPVHDADPERGWPAQQRMIKP